MTNNQPHSSVGQGPSLAVQQALQLYQNRLNQLLQKIVDRAVRENPDCSQEQVAAFPGRIDLGFFYFEKKLEDILFWLFRSKEEENFTYDLTEQNKQYLASAISLITSTPYQVVRGYIDELNQDVELRRHIQETTANSPFAHKADRTANYGRRLGWYAIARIIKPRVVVETGVDKGLGSCVLSAALERNSQEGYPGKYYGTDINPHAGFLYHGKYREYGEILYGDSLESLSALKTPIDLFINDSDHSEEYEAKEYDLIHTKMNPRGYILGDNSHVTPALCQFAQKTGRQFIFIPEGPEGHWYPGAGIGVAFSR